MVDTVLLLSGPLAVGKTSLRDLLLADHSFHHIRSSEYLRALATAQQLSTDRLGLQEIGDRLDRETDYKWLLTEVAEPLLSAQPDVERWLVDAVRKKRQVEHFRNRFGASIVHIHLDAAEEVLKQRYEFRARHLGNYVPGAYELAIAHDNEQQSRALINVADIVIRTDISSPSSVVQEALAGIRSR